MRLHCLGTAGYHPNETRQTSSYFLPETGILLDAGTGTFRLPELIETSELDILLSHAHLDHVVGLTFLLGVLFRRPVEEVRVWGQAEKLEVVENHLLNDLLFPVKLPVTWCPIDDLDQIELDQCRVTWRPQVHPGGSVAYRLDFANEASLVYATDSNGEHDDETLNWMSHSDILLHECNFPDHQKEWAIKTGHCYVSRVAEIGEATRPKRLLLTHVDPVEGLILDPGDERFSVPFEVVSDKQVIEF